MTRSIGSNLPPSLLNRLGELDISREKHRVILLTTLDGDDWPRHAMLSYFEVIASNNKSLLLLTYAKSQTTRNLLKNGKALLLFVDEEMSYYVRAQCEKLDEGSKIGAPNELIFSCKISDVSEDKLPTAKILTGLTFSGYDPGMTLEERTGVRTNLLKLAKRNF